MKTNYYRKLLTILVMILTAFSASAYDFEVNGIYYNIASSNTAEVTKFYSGCYEGDIIIPATVMYDNKSYSVTSICDKAFDDCIDLSSVTIPNSVISIGQGAFQYCSGLISVNLPNSITSINTNTFDNCTSLTSITIPNSVTSIGDAAFYNCSSLTSVTIPNPVISIGRYAFAYCSGLTGRLIIPNSVVSIGEGAFYDCGGLTSVTIGNSVTTIDGHAFSGCSGLTGELIIPNSVISIGEMAFWMCSGLTGELNLPNSVIFIGESAFFYCKNLTSVNLPSSITSISAGTFSECSSLTRVTIPNSVTSIGDRAFDECRNLSGELNIPNSVISIGRGAFFSCRNLTSIIIGNSVTSIGEYAFSYSYSLQDVYCNAASVPNTDLGAFYGTPINTCTLHVVKGSKAAYSVVEPWKNFKEIVEFSLFPDCPAGEIRDAALYLYNLGIVEGENGLLVPNRETKRAEVAKISLYGAYNGRSNVPAVLPSDNYPSVYYDLQNPSTYYYRPAKALLYLEYGDGVSPFDRDRLAFEPEGPISRVNVLKVLLEAFNFKPDLSSNSNPFPNDADVVALASMNPVKMGYIRRAVELGIITTANAAFRPHDNCTRGEIILMLARLIQKTSWQKPQTGDYFEPLNMTLKTIALGLGLPMGNFSHYTKTSFVLNGVMPLVFDHTYNSYNTTLPEVFYGALTVNDSETTYQPMGDGWSHSYHSFIKVVGNPTNPDARLIVHWGGGGIDVYKSNGSQLVAESLGVYDDCELDGSDVVITTKDQTKYRFTPLGGSMHYLTDVTDRNGNTLKVNYESGVTGFQRVKSVSDGYRSLTFYYRSGSDLVSRVTDPLSRSIQFNYKLNNQTGRYQLSSFIDAEGHTTNYIYEDKTTAGTSMLLTRIQLPKGNYIKNEYDANCRLKKTESGRGSVPTTQTAITVAANYGMGATTTQSTVNVLRNGQNESYNFTYNSNNMVTGLTGEEGLYVNSAYGNTTHPELPTAIHSNSTNVSNMTYDAKGNMTDITVIGDGTLTTTMTYNNTNDLTSITDPKGYKTTYTYDANGNLTDINAPENVNTHIDYNSKGLPIAVTDPMGIITRMEYNTYGNLTQTKLPALGLTTSATYDRASRLLSTTDALNRITSFTYDKNDNMLTETDAASHTTSFEYDDNDNLTDITNAKGGVTTMTYDNATDWLTSVSFANSTKRYAYNEDGTLSTYTKPDGTTFNYIYDALGRVINDGVNSYTYDNKMRLSSITGGGKTLSFSYDGFNRIIETSCNGFSNSYAYDKNGNRTKINNTTYSYDRLNRLTSVEFSNKTITYTYRKDSQLSKVTYPNGMTTNYSYDPVGRLTGKTTKLSNGNTIASYTLTLDKLGNIINQTTTEPYNDMILANEEINYTYNNGNRITKSGSTTFAFDANGNTTKRGTESYIWDEVDRLTKAGSIGITYDPLGLIASYGTITFTTDPLDMGNVLSDSKSGAQYIYGNGLEARVINGVASYYVTDLRGSVVAIVNENGAITHQYQYDEFGKVTQKQEANYNPFQYVGKYGVMYLNDHLYYMRARHYDPTIGRFLSEDPIWSTNLYPYADNNPITGIDPRGLYTQKEVDRWRDKELHFLDNNRPFMNEDQYRKKYKQILKQYTSMSKYVNGIEQGILYIDRMTNTSHINANIKYSTNTNSNPKSSSSNSNTQSKKSQSSSTINYSTRIYVQSDIDNQLANSGIGGNYPKGQIWLSKNIIQPVGVFYDNVVNSISGGLDKVAYIILDGVKRYIKF